MVSGCASQKRKTTYPAKSVLHYGYDGVGGDSQFRPVETRSGRGTRSERTAVNPDQGREVLVDGSLGDVKDQRQAVLRIQRGVDIELRAGQGGSSGVCQAVPEVPVS
jgi:hypothetical protein